MKNDWAVSVSIGLLIATASILGNIRRADIHLVSTYPDVITALLGPALVYLAVRRRAAGGEHAPGLRRFGMRLGAIAGAIFAVALGLFTAWWLPTRSLSLPAVAVLSAFGLTVLASWLSAATAARLHAARA